MKKRRKSPLHKKARKGFRGYPVATVAFYGPDDKMATKMAVGIVPSEGAEPGVMKRWHSDTRDIRSDLEILTESSEFIKSHGALSVVMTDRIIGCPHQEGTDYPEGEACPECPFWAGRDRWTGERIH